MPVSAASYGFSCWRDAAALMSSAHQHNDIEINLSPSPLTYLIGGQTVTVPAGSIAAFWAGAPHQLVETDVSSEVTWLTVPLPTFVSWPVPKDVTSTLLAGRVLLADTDWSRGWDLSRWQHDLGPAAGRIDPHLTAIAARLEVEAFACRFALAAAAVGPDGPQTSAGAAIGRGAVMAAWLADNFAGPVRVADVAAAAHLHPNYATAVFSRAFGVSIRAYLTAIRIAEAQRRLITTTATVADVAAEAGFTSQSSFYDAFVGATGMPPNRFRQLNSRRS